MKKTRRACVLWLLLMALQIMSLTAHEVDDILQDEHPVEGDDEFMEDNDAGMYAEKDVADREDGDDGEPDHELLVRRLLDDDPGATTVIEEYKSVPGLEDMELIAFNIEYADINVLKKLIDWSYSTVVEEHSRHDGFLRALDMPDFLHRTLNPGDEDILDDERSLLREAATELREQQGLLRDDMVVHRGFLARGSPLRFLRQLAHGMHSHRRSRRLEGVEVLDHHYDRDL